MRRLQFYLFVYLLITQDTTTANAISVLWDRIRVPHVYLSPHIRELDCGSNPEYRRRNLESH